MNSQLEFGLKNPSLELVSGHFFTYLADFYLQKYKLQDRDTETCTKSFNGHMNAYKHLSLLSHLQFTDHNIPLPKKKSIDLYLKNSKSI